MNKNKLTDPKHVASAFNNYFSNIAQKLINTHHDKLPTNHTDQKIHPNTLCLYPATPEELSRILKELLNKYLVIVDEIPDAIIKASVTFIVEPLTDIANSSFESGIFPNNLKTVKVTPLHNKGAKSNIANYRPVSVLSGFSKIMEKNALEDFLNKGRLISDSQHGFRAGKSTQSAIFAFLIEVLKAVDDKKHVSWIFPGLCKAFDVIDHGILLCKLSNYGIRGQSEKWIQSYLSFKLNITIGVLCSKIAITLQIVLPIAIPNSSCHQI
ncbi:uncharacterized protein LOC126419517 [Schistocerca serialis cubense]|uniref:uncharacterized protein LOC126419517 n=1 Tax=Schistocerca serialis cubense TaxID=2023355 RepID=UPI00214DF194|nr:uncharacterized protein LOC126419517 [Schistocerca serialis cubense]